MPASVGTALQQDTDDGDEAVLVVVPDNELLDVTPLNVPMTADAGGLSNLRRRSTCTASLSTATPSEEQ